MLEKDQQLYPYRIQVKHELIERDMEKRVAMCKRFSKEIDNNEGFLNGVWFSKKIDYNEGFLNDVWFSDKAQFLLNGHFNSKNWVFGGSENPYGVVGRPLHSKKSTTWVTISKHGIIGPFAVTLTVTKERFVPVLEQY